MSGSSTSNLSSSPLFAPIAAAAVSWVVISLGFFGLKMLMEQRPEFVGQPMAFSKVVLVQEAPRIVSRKLSEDVSSFARSSRKLQTSTSRCRGAGIIAG